MNTIILGMIEFSKGNIHDVEHFLKVHYYAKLIGECEQLDQDKQFILEVASIVHDIACPFCREKYGHTKGPFQEKEGIPISKEFLQQFGLEEYVIERVSYLVGHHHTFNGVDDLDYQILLEADYLVNAYDEGLTQEQIKIMRKSFFKTKTGIQLLNTLYQL